MPISAITKAKISITVKGNNSLEITLSIIPKVLPKIKTKKSMTPHIPTPSVINVLFMIYLYL